MTVHSVTLEGYEMTAVDEEGSVSGHLYMPGDRVRLSDGDDFYPGAVAVVLGVAMGKGMFYAGQRVYDVAIDDDGFGLYFDKESAEDLAAITDEDNDDVMSHRVTERGIVDYADDDEGR